MSDYTQESPFEFADARMWRHPDGSVRLDAGFLTAYIDRREQLRARAVAAFLEAEAGDAPAQPDPDEWHVDGDGWRKGRRWLQVRGGGVTVCHDDYSEGPDDRSSGITYPIDSARKRAALGTDDEYAYWNCRAVVDLLDFLARTQGDDPATAKPGEFWRIKIKDGDDEWLSASVTASLSGSWFVFCSQGMPLMDRTTSSDIVAAERLKAGE